MSKKCTLKRTCKALDNLLGEMGVEHPSFVCNGTRPCRSIFDGVRLAYRYLNPDNAQIVAAFIRSLFGDTLPIARSTNAISQITENPPFHCPELDIDIYQPCQVKSCAYWTSHNEWTRNCILYYFVDYQREELDVKELAFLLDETSIQIRSRTIHAMTKLRNLALKHKTRQEQLNRPVKIYGNGCSVCGKTTEKPYTYHSGYTYCSAACYSKKPPLDLQLETEFGLAAKRVLEVCIDSFIGRRPVCHALGVTTKQLNTLCARHCIDISHLD
jgi:hypothetical protein